MNMRRYIGIIILIMFSLNLYSQNNYVKGLIKDFNSNTPIPYAYVFIKGTSFGTISNNDGQYVFYLPKSPSKDSIVVSCIGYSNKSFSLSSMHDRILDIYLKSAPILLHEVKVSPVDIKSILRKSLELIGENYPISPSILKGVFHQSLKQNDVFVRLVDAAVEIYSPTYKTNHKETNQIKLLNTQASFDNSVMGSQIPYQPYIILDMVFLNNTIGALIKSSDTYKFNYSGIITYGNQNLYVIEFSSLKSLNANYSTSGTIYIDKATHAIVSFRAITKKQYESKISYLFNEKPVTASLKFESGEARIDFIKFNSKWVLNYIGVKDVFNIRFNDKSELYKMEFFSELFINETNFERVNKFNRNEIINPNEDLYKQIGKYDNTYWDTINRITPNSFEKIPNQLSK